MVPKKMEIRKFSISNIKTRSQDDEQTGAGHVSGYAAVFDSPTIIAESFKETIAPGAFSETLATNNDIRCLFNHNWDNVLGRTKAGTLQLTEDDHGLGFDVDLPDTTTGRDLAVSMARSDINQCSFGFVPLEEEWDYSDPDLPLRTITKIKLYEVSIVADPAYEDTEATLSRSKAETNIIKNVEKRKEILKQIERGMKND